MPQEASADTTRVRFPNVKRLLNEVDTSMLKEQGANVRSAAIKRERAIGYDGCPRSPVELDRMVASDEVFKVLVAEQQFANRKAQMYGLAGMCELLTAVLGELQTIRTILSNK